jgi:hypothetical protein
MTKQARMFCSAQRPLIEKPGRERYACLDHRWASTRTADISFQDCPVLDSKPYRVSVS